MKVADGALSHGAVLSAQLELRLLVRVFFIFQAAEPEDLMLICYTSGTTGKN